MFTEPKASSRHMSNTISKPEKIVWYLNGIVFIAILFLVVSNFNELKWSHRNLYEYLNDSIPSSEDRISYSEEAEYILEGQFSKVDEEKLVEAARIDPNSEANFWLAEYYYAYDNYTDALRHYLLFIESDPSNELAIINAARILKEQGKNQQALEVLDLGIAHQEQRVNKGKPIINRTVHDTYNNKAIFVYKSSQSALQTLNDFKKTLTH